MKYGCQSMVDKVTGIMIKHPKEAFINQEYINENYEACKYYGIPNFEKSQKEYKIFEDILKENVENVYYLPENDSTNLDSIYAHDSLKITKKGAIYFNMAKDVRKGEAKATEKYLKSMGVPTLGYIEEPGKMEGLPKIQKKLEDAGCKVYTYPGEEISIKGTGGATCFTSPIHREK